MGNYGFASRDVPLASEVNVETRRTGCGSEVGGGEDAGGEEAFVGWY